MKWAKEHRDPETGGLYYDHTTIYKKDPEPSDDVKQLDNIKMEMAEHAQLNKLSKVHHPKHYNAGKIEVIDAIVDWNLDFIEGNVVKYVTRAKHKGDELGDLKKARWYLDYMIGKMEDDGNI
tara:strand:- start:2132 stop:2497 length:366 start_codon:yes stop_codon:yes gene_type:complete